MHVMLHTIVSLLSHRVLMPRYGGEGAHGRSADVLFYDNTSMVLTQPAVKGGVCLAHQSCLAIILILLHVKIVPGICLYSGARLSLIMCCSMTLFLGACPRWQSEVRST